MKVHVVTFKFMDEILVLVKKKNIGLTFILGFFYLYLNLEVEEKSQSFFLPLSGKLLQLKKVCYEKDHYVNFVNSRLLYSLCTN